MNEKLESVKELLKKNNQEQLLDCYDTMDDKNKEMLLDDILTINFPQINELYRNKDKVDFSEDKIEPIDYVDKEKLSEEERKEIYSIGEEAIKNNELAIVTMAGGQGTRLGHSGPKGTYIMKDIDNKSIFELLCEKFKRGYEKFGVYVPWYIMTSKQNDATTRKFFKKNNYFGYPENNIIFFVQGELPVLDENGKLMLNTEGMVNKVSDGHGGIFSSLRESGNLYDMKSRGVKWVYIGGVDNIIANFIDPYLIGLCKKKKVPVGGKSVIKAGPDERVGVFCKRNGKPAVIEYIEITKEMAEARNEDGELKMAEAHILCNMFSVDAIEQMEDKLPYHCQHKKIEYMNSDGEIVKPESPNGYKFESFLFDAFERFDDMAILRVKREEEFSPVKNAEGVDSPETATKLYKELNNMV